CAIKIAAAVYRSGASVRFSLPYHGAKSAFSLTGRTEIETGRVHEIELRRSGRVYDDDATGNSRDRCRRTTAPGGNRRFRFPSPAKGYQSSSGSFCDQAGRG